MKALALALLLFSVPVHAEVTSTSVTIHWTKATDAQDLQSALQYGVCQSRSNILTTVALCEAAMVSPWLTNIDSYTASGLIPLTGYFFNVVVRDTSGLKSLYAGLSVTTLEPDPIPLPPDTPPVPGAGGLLSVSNVSSSSLLLNWTLATDDHSGLAYEVRKSIADNMGTVADAETNGTVIKAYTPDLSSFKVTGLKVSNVPFYTVIVKDLAGQKAIYKTVRAHYGWSSF